jgi:hypothetical protein
MALKKSFTFNGINYVAFENVYFETGESSVNTPLLYIKVESVSGSKEKVQTFVSFTDEAKKQKLFEKQFAFAPSMDAGNFIAQAYAYLKTLPEFAGATDC